MGKYDEHTGMLCYENPTLCYDKITKTFLHLLYNPFRINHSLIKRRLVQYGSISAVERCSTKSVDATQYQDERDMMDEPV